MRRELECGLRPRAVRSAGVVSLASAVDPMALESGCQALEAATGWRVECSPSALMREGDFAGTPEARARVLRELWCGGTVDAVLCSRGGYGSNYLLPLLDFRELRAHPRAFVGYSDNTALLLALERAGLVCFHGPMVAADFSCGRADVASFAAALGGDPLVYEWRNGAVRSLAPGEAEGTITGGCLSLVVASLGTPWELDAAGKLLFLEDVNEKPFRIDRMLRQLLLAGKLDGVRGVIFGAMKGCAAPAGEESLEATILRLLGPLQLPVVFGVPSGHVERGNLTLPFGVPARLRAQDDSVRLEIAAATVAQD